MGDRDNIVCSEYARRGQMRVYLALLGWHFARIGKCSPGSGKACENLHYCLPLHKLTTNERGLPEVGSIQYRFS